MLITQTQGKTKKSLNGGGENENFSSYKNQVAKEQ
jgi:hypothetical protein